MRKFTRNVLALIVAAAMLLTAAGCSRGEDKQLRPLTVWVFSEQYRDQLLSCFGDDFPAIDWEPRIEIVAPEDMDSKLEEAVIKGSGLPDVFMLAPDDLYRYTNSELTAELGSLERSFTSSGYFSYAIDAGRDKDGTLKAVCWQPDPGLFFYRRSIAKAYLGTDDPEEIQRQISDWDGFRKTALAIREGSRGKTSMVVGIEDMMRTYMAADSEGWIFDNRLTVPPTAASFLEYATQLADDELIYEAEQWSAAWVGGISDPQSVFGYFSSGMGMHSVLEKACGGTSEGSGSFGDWAAVKGPQSSNWGGCWLAVYSGTQLPEEAETFLRYFTAEEEAMVKNCLINGTFSASRTVVDEIKYDAQFYENFLGGQNLCTVLSDAAGSAEMHIHSEYESVINAAFAECVRSCAFGHKTRDAALDDFVRTVEAAFPELL